MKLNTCIRKHRLLIAAGFFVSFFFVQQSCTKIDTDKLHLNDPTEKFFTVPTGTKPQVKRVIENLKEQNKLTGFIKDIVKDEGYALWNKAMINTRQSSSQNILPNASASVDTFIHIPLVLENTFYVNSFILAKLNGDMSLQLFRGREYASYGFGDINADTNTAEKLALQLMVMTKQIFGKDKYVLKDSRLFSTHGGHLPAHSLADRKFKISLQSNSSSLWYSEPVTTCTYIPEQDCPYNPCTGPGGTCDGCVLCVGGDYSCETSIKWYFIADPPDPSNGGGGGTGGGGNTGPQQCNPTPLIENGLPPCPRGNDTGWEFEPVNDNQIIIDSLQGYPCAQAILTAMPSVNAEVKKILHDVFGVNDEINLIVVPYTFADTTADGETIRLGGDNYRMRLNTYMLNNSTKDYIAATIIHEALHAYILYNQPLPLGGGNMDSTTFAQAFPIFSQYSTTSISASNMAQHIIMASKYIGLMKGVLHSLNPSLPDYNAESLCWGGLEKTSVWRTRADSNSLTFRNTVAKYINRQHYDSTGYPVNYSNFGYIKCP